MHREDWLALDSSKYELLTILYLPERRPSYKKVVDHQLMKLVSNTVIRRLFPELTKGQRRRLRHLVINEQRIAGIVRRRNNWNRKQRNLLKS